MKNIYCFLLIFFPLYLFSQQDSTGTTKNKQEKKPKNSLGLGIKAGLNFTNVTSASSISNSNETGYQVGLFLDPSSSSILGSRTELVYSHQGYNYATGQNTTGHVYLDYIMLAQLMAINITHFVQIQIGSQIAYLINAKADSSMPTGNVSIDNALSYYNRIDFGFSGGLEIRPFMGILVGARYNLSITNLYKIPTTTGSGEPPSYVPTSSDLNFKNNLIQIYVGYRF